MGDGACAITQHNYAYFHEVAASIWSNVDCHAIILYKTAYREGDCMKQVVHSVATFDGAGEDHQVFSDMASLPWQVSLGNLSTRLIDIAREVWACAS